MSTGLRDRLGPAAVAPYHGHDVVAWTLRCRGIVTTWRAPGMADNPLIGPWAYGALAHGCCYADLLYSELLRLG